MRKYLITTLAVLFTTVAFAQTIPIELSQGKDIQNYSVSYFDDNGNEGSTASGYEVIFDSRFNPPSPHNSGWNQNYYIVTCEGQDWERGIFFHVEADDGTLLASEMVQLGTMVGRDGVKNAEFRIWEHYCR